MSDIGRIFIAAYADAWRLAKAMWRALLIVGLMALGSGLAVLFVSGMIRTNLGSDVLEALGRVAFLYVSAPYFVAFYRYLLHGTETRWPESLRVDPAVMRFFAWSAIFAFVESGPSFIFDILTQPTDSLDPTHPSLNPARAFVTFGALIAIWIFLTRMVTALPGTATGRIETWANWFAETRGRFWFITFATLSPIVPIIVGFALVSAVLLGTSPSSAILLMPLFLIAVIAAGLVGLAATAQIYRVIKGR